MVGTAVRNRQVVRWWLVVALAASAAHGLVQAEDRPAADAAAARPRVEILQDGFIVEPKDGEYVLARAPFIVRVPPGHGRLSVIATTNEEAIGNARALWSAPLVAPLGTGSNAVPLALLVTESGLEFYGGLTPSFVEQWGPVLGAAQLGDYAVLRPSLPREPNLLMTSRQQANVLLKRDGTQLLPVHKIGTQAIDVAPIEALTLFLLFEHSAEGRLSWAVVDGIDVARLRFVPVARGRATPPPPLRSVLDCGSSGVVQAVRQSDFQRLERILEQGVDPNTRSARNNVTLLMCAVSGLDVHSNAVWVLLEAGADVHAKTSHNETALLWAARTGDRGITTASRLNAVEQLLSRGAEVDAADDEGETPLLGAVRMGHAEIVAALLSAGANANKANAAGETPRVRAKRLGMLEIADLIGLFLDE
jgi:hypothetical protein